MSVTNPTSCTFESTDSMSREEMYDAFLAVTNIIQPKHKYDIEYPISRSDLKTSYSKGNVRARCGPRNDHKDAFYAVNKDYVQRVSTERYVQLIIHEMTHLELISDYQKSSHPPEFWDQMAQYAYEALDQHWGEIQNIFSESLSRKEVIKNTVTDPNRTMVDKRRETVHEARSRVAAALDVKLANYDTKLSGTRFTINRPDYYDDSQRIRQFHWYFTPASITEVVEATRGRNNGISYNGMGTWEVEQPPTIFEAGDKATVEAHSEDERLRASALYWMIETGKTDYLKMYKNGGNW